MRPRRRYLVLEVVRNLSKSELYRELVPAVRASGGDADQLRIIFKDDGTGRWLLRCGHDQVTAVRAAAAGSGGRIARVVGVSGTIRAAKRKFLAPPQKG